MIHHAPVPQLLELCERAAGISDEWQVKNELYEELRPKNKVARTLRVPVVRINQDEHATSFTLRRKPKQQPLKRMIGRFIVADPAICHGQPTFLGTRILVADVLEQVASGIARATIVEEWRGNVSSDAISEAVRLARQAFRDHSDQYTAPEYVLERAQGSHEAH